MYVYMCTAYVSGTQRTEEYMRSLWLEWQMFLSHHVETGNQSPVCYSSSQYSYWEPILTTVSQYSLSNLSSIPSFFWMLFCILKISWFWLSVLKVLWWNFLVSMNMCVCVNTCPYIYIWSSYYCHPIIVLHLPQWLLQSFLAHLFTGFNCWAKKKC